MPNKLPVISSPDDLYAVFEVTNLDALADVLRNLPADTSFTARGWHLPLSTTLRVLTVFKDQQVGLKLNP